MAMRDCSGNGHAPGDGASSAVLALAAPAARACLRPREAWRAWGPAGWALALTFLALTFLASVAPAHAAAPDRIEALAPVARLTGQIAYLIDNSGKLGIQQISHPSAQDAFRTPSSTLRTLYDDRPHWIRVVMQQEGDWGDWVLSMSTTGLREVQFHGPFDVAGAPLGEVVRTGLDRPWASRPLQSERFAFRIRLNAPGQYTAYLRVVSKTSQPLTLNAFDLPDHMAARQDKRLFDGITYGILLTLLVYNLALAASFRDRTYVHYVLASAAALMTLVSFNGQGARYLFPNWPAAMEASYVVFPSLWILFGALFAQSFLNLTSRAPRLARLNQLTMALSLVALLFGLRGEITTAQRMIELLALAGMLTVFVAALLVLARGYRPAAWYVAGQMLLFSAVMTVVLVNWGQLDRPFVVATGLQIGVAAELVVFAIALSSRVRLLRHESSRLETRAASLAHEARTDPLTGLSNRAGLARQAQELLKRPGCHALMLLDLDRFKPVNDIHGHAAGDAVLVEVARRLTQAVREHDAVARLGGDEFVILFADDPGQAMLEERAQRLQAALRGPIDIGSGRMVGIDSSVGVATSPQDGCSLDELLIAADLALYRAKEAGRGCFRFQAAEGLRAA
ncbi:MAG: diguanylate cyclase [Betaproteobacteria bacterium]